MKPDFLLIPMVVYDQQELSPTDKIVYAIVYWYEHMRDGKCIASNKAIGTVAGIDERTVRVGLERLEKAGFIKRDFKDKARKIRLEIRCLVKYAVSKKDNKIHHENDESIKLDLKMLETKTESPGEYARRFFSGDKILVAELITELMLKSHGTNKDALEKSLRQFWVYWTESNKSGTKQRWELQQTFDLKRRLYTWLSRSGMQSSHAPRAGAGITV